MLLPQLGLDKCRSCWASRFDTYRSQRRQLLSTDHPQIWHLRGRVMSGRSRRTCVIYSSWYVCVDDIITRDLLADVGQLASLLQYSEVASPIATPATRSHDLSCIS